MNPGTGLLTQCRRHHHLHSALPAAIDGARALIRNVESCRSIVVVFFWHVQRELSTLSCGMKAIFY